LREVHRQLPGQQQIGQVSEMYGMLAYQNGSSRRRNAFNKASGFPKADKRVCATCSGIVLFEMQRFDEARAAFELLLMEPKDRRTRTMRSTASR
jgi:hypothetical protein